MEREDNAIEAGTPKRVPMPGKDIDENTLYAMQVAQIMKPDIKGSVEQLVKDKKMSRVMLDIMPEIAMDMQTYCESQKDPKTGKKLSKEKFLSEVWLQISANMGVGEILTKDHKATERKGEILAKIKRKKGEVKLPKAWVKSNIENAEIMVDLWKAIETHLT